MADCNLGAVSAQGFLEALTSRADQSKESVKLHFSKNVESRCIETVRISPRTRTLLKRGGSEGRRVRVGPLCRCDARYRASTGESGRRRPPLGCARRLASGCCSWPTFSRVRPDPANPVADLGLAPPQRCWPSPLPAWSRHGYAAFRWCLRRYSAGTRARGHDRAVPAK